MIARHWPPPSLSLSLLLTLRQLTAATSTSDLTSIKKTAKKYGVIGIDEGQFVSANPRSVGSITSSPCHYPLVTTFSLLSFQTLLSSVRTWQMRERQSLWLHSTAPSKERYIHGYCCCYTLSSNIVSLIWSDSPAAKLFDFGFFCLFVFPERL